MYIPPIKEPPGKSCVCIPEPPPEIAKSPLPKTTGPVFYNPRRPYIYWAGINSKHKSYKEAIQSLAKKFERSPEWVKANMGATNDLKQINQNLRDRKAADPAG